MKKQFTLLLMLIAPQINFVFAQPTWNQKTDFTSCSYDGVCFSINNEIYYGLGIICTGSETHNFSKFNTATNTWSSIATFPGQTRRKASAFSINGKGYVCLGYSNGSELQDLWEYDPVANTWTAKANFAGVARGSAVADVVNGKAYVGTGFSPMNGYPMDWWEYNPATNLWTAKATMPGIALYESHTFAIGDTVYVVGGAGGNLVLEHNEFWAYSTTANTWTQKLDFPGGTPRWYATTFSLSGKGYCGYGLVGINYVSDFYSYNPASGEWISVPSNGLNLLFNGGGGGVATANAGYCIAGTAYNAQPATTDLWEFIPASATGIYEETNNSNSTLQIIPNPAKDIVVINSSSTGNFAVINTLGQTIINIQLTNNENKILNVSKLNGGTYFLQSSDYPLINKRFTIIK